MTPATRQAEIANIIRQCEHVTVNELAEALNISRETIRRDLSELARVGKVQKFHGGASLPMVTGEGHFHERMGKNVAAKVQIAVEAVKFVSPNETILIDTGSTTLYFAEKLAELSDVTVVTNSTEIARVMSTGSPLNRTFLLGGEFHGDNRQTIGSMAIAQVQSFRAHHAILTVGALDTRTGVMDYSIEEAQLARAMIEQAEILTLLVDSSKFEQIASFEVCKLARVTNLVCDKPPSNKMEAVLKEANVNIIIAGQ
ncbi:MAG: DeoR/GlpR family DNA-binding transcription regulator [Thermodesulfobacteriota bacterium]|nr:DeoR/GlpR family DNA-binding transcription regulator [Thermodesulfobacteriota bacterium]